jgi:hypothetical protein
MKKKPLFFVLALIFISALITSCDDSGCEDQGMLECDNGKCCDYDVPWNDGHGSCYSSLSYCRETGWACSRCW